MFVLAIVCWVIAVIVLAVGLLLRSRWTIAGGIAAGVLGFVFMIFSMSFTQDIGEARVLKDWTGNINPVPVTTPGWHWKEPWVDAIDFDIRNQIAAFIDDGKDTYNGQTPNGPQITFQDKDGVSANLDLVVIYSIRPDSVTDIYKEFLSQDNFRARLIEQDIRSVPRDVASKYSTIALLTSRSEVSAKIQAALEERWKDAGVIVESVSLQEIRYPEAVRLRFEDAQNSRTEVEKAKAELDKAKVDAEQKVVIATAEAEANRILAASLTPAILQSRYIEMLSKAQTIVVPSDFTALGNLNIPAPQ